MSLPPFHLAFPVDDLAAVRAFWGGVLGCGWGAAAPSGSIFHFHGHQLGAHLAPAAVGGPAAEAANAGDGHKVPVPHFGLVLDMAQWRALADRLTAHGLAFAIAPHQRLRGEPGEQATMFFRDPAGNAVEIKAFADLGQLFATG